MPGNRTARLALPALLLFLALVPAGALAHEGSHPATIEGHSHMSNPHLDALIRRIDPEARSQDGKWQFTVAGTPVILITDEDADRMRIMSAVVTTDELDGKTLMRLMQANFDSALDARYAVAHGTLWSTFIHPLSALQDREFLEGLGQVVNLVHSFGSTYSSGALIFRGGDSQGLQRRELIDSLIEKGTTI